jgi:beta-lactamase class D
MNERQPLKRGRTALCLLFLVVCGAIAGTPRDTVMDFSRFYGGLRGCFVLHETWSGRTIRYNPQLCSTPLSPASTFKIPNSLIGLETGVIPDQHYVIRWDSLPKRMKSWNRDHDLSSAIANSVVWYYQELARRVGPARMQHWLDTLGYGNRDISGGIDRFWLGSSILISPNQQCEFLLRLRNETIPFSKRTISIVKEILVLDKGPDWTLRGKTGFTDFDSTKDVGWFVGWVERPEGAVIFVNCVRSDDRAKDEDRMFEQRKPIALAILKALGYIGNPTGRP